MKMAKMGIDLGSRLGMVLRLRLKMTRMIGIRLNWDIHYFLFSFFRSFLAGVGSTDSPRQVLSCATFLQYPRFRRKK